VQVGVFDGNGSPMSVLGMLCGVLQMNTLPALGPTLLVVIDSDQYLSSLELLSLTALFLT
jgi:hypothetical protein